MGWIGAGLQGFLFGYAAYTAFHDNWIVLCLFFVAYWAGVILEAVLD